MTGAASFRSLTGHRGVTLVEVIVVMVISVIIVGAIGLLLVTIAGTNSNALENVQRMNESDLSVNTLRRYAQDAHGVSLNGNTHVVFTRADGQYDLYYDAANRRLLAISPDSAPNPFQIATQVSAVNFSLPTPEVVRMDLEMTFDDGDTMQRRAEVLCRNVEN